MTKTYTNTRWTVLFEYGNGSSDIYYIEEIEHLDPIVEGGPDWNEIEKIVITYNYKDKNYEYGDK